MLTTSNKGTSNKQEVLTNNIECFEIDTESKENSQGDSNADKQYN